MLAVGKILIVFALAVILAFGTFGMLDMGMGMQMDGTMNPCLFSTGTEICTMTPLAHIAASQSVFTTIVTYGDVLVLLALSIAAFFALSLFWRSQAPPLALVQTHIHRKESIPRSYLQESFSSGILNPKLF